MGRGWRLWISSVWDISLKLSHFHHRKKEHLDILCKGHILLSVVLRQTQSCPNGTIQDSPQDKQEQDLSPYFWLCSLSLTCLCPVCTDFLNCPLLNEIEEQEGKFQKSPVFCSIEFFIILIILQKPMSCITLSELLFSPRQPVNYYCYLSAPLHCLFSFIFHFQ